MDVKENALQWMRANERPAVQLVLESASTGFSKLGGEPNLPGDVEWPRSDSQALSFLAQFDLAEVAVCCVLPDFPTSGRLYFFYDAANQPWGFDPADAGKWRVVYSRSQPALVAAKTPDEVNDKNNRFAEVRVSFHATTSRPSFDRYADECLGGLENFTKGRPLDDDLWDTFYEDSGDAQDEQRVDNRIGGYPSAIQNDSMERECQLASNGIYCGGAEVTDPRAEELASGRADWLLLFQLDSNENVGMCWGDVGRLYFWIKRQDLRVADFTRAWLVLQCG
jgi:uncharacterized protein YwqG